MNPALKRTVPALNAVDRHAERAGRGGRYWRSLEELTQPEKFAELAQREFPERAAEWPEGASRRDFLKLAAGSIALAGLAGCTRQPIEKIVPYVRQPEELVPGQPLFFATAMTLGGYATGLLVESHEGHPTKIEGNPKHPMSLGASSIFHQASLLDLYDPDRSQAVLANGEVSSWTAFLAALHNELEFQRATHGAGLRILTETTTSPTLLAQIKALLAEFPEARWHRYEPINRDNVHDGAQLAFGDVVEPQYFFDRARVILSLDSDFLHSHPAALRYAREFIDGRRISGGRMEMNRLYVVEAAPTVTGSNADHRLPLRASDIPGFTGALARELGINNPQTDGANDPQNRQWITAIAQELRANRGQGIIVAGENQSPVVHALAHQMNESLGNHGRTIHFTEYAADQPINQLASLRALTEDLKGGAVQALIILGGNPAYNAPADFEFAQYLAQARFRAHLSVDVNETSALCQWHVPQNHYLESWSDARAFDGTISIVQPLILPLYAGKSAHELLDCMLGNPTRSDYDIVRDHWESQHRWADFEKGWRQALLDGLVSDTALPSREVSLRHFQLPSQTSSHDAYELIFRPDPSVWDGRFANNGWLQELAKPVTKLTWDNAALISPALARKFSLSNGDMVELDSAGRTLALPVWITPGHAEESVTVYLGYGRSHIGRVGASAGFNTFALRTADSFVHPQFTKLKKLDGSYPLASTQNHHVIDSAERQVYREGTLAQFLANREFLKQSVEVPDREHETLFNPNEHNYNGYRWGMSIDLTACIGCNACVIACQSENNIPVVGKQQVAVGRAMQWIRVDTYFSGLPENPEMRHQPVPCMQCEDAPCELVCPVGATLHDHEGLNLQVYNRCVGTRYCSNNCPYKVRRFNFLHYADEHTPSLALMRNPNVTVRFRGVMEKCTYCIQRISAARIKSEEQNRSIRDNEIQTACQQSCPTQAIVFGNLSDPNSRVSKLKTHPLDYSMLGELNTRPRTTYLAKLRNPNPPPGDAGRAEATASHHA